MSASTLKTPLIKEVIAELLKSKDSLHDVDTVGKIIACGREGMNAYVEFLQEQVQSVTLKVDDEMSVKLKNGQLYTDKNFPFGLLKDMAPFVRELSISGFDENVRKQMTEVLQHPKLEKVEVLTEIPMDMWRILFESSAKQVRTHTQWIVAANALEDVNVELDHLEIVNSVRDETLMNVLSNFRIRCKTLKIEWLQTFEHFGKIFLPGSRKVSSNAVEQLELFFNQIPGMFIRPEYIKDVLEAFQRMFPRVKKVKLLSVVSEDPAYKQPFAPDHGFIKTIVETLSNHISNAKIGYDLEFDYKCDNEVIWYDAVRNSLVEDFTSNGFKMVEGDEKFQLWSYEKKIAENKSLSIQYKVDEFNIDVDETEYLDMLDDLGLDDDEDPYYYYDDDDTEIDYEDWYNEEADYY